ncbi:MAG: hypothetical protein HZC23_06520 [Rhodocyclales bacterium]|nr:hypothetical protein [Rhodocyclales bacterium]
MAAAIGLYVYDSALLLRGNEGILFPRRSNGWGVSFGSRNFQIMGKEPFLPNPFLPHRPLFRLSWKFEGAPLSEACDPPRGAFMALAPWVWIMAISLFVLFPLGFFSRLGDRMLLMGIGSLYLSILVALVLLWHKREQLSISHRRFAALAFESLICPPFALNMIRHVSVSIPVAEDLVIAARRLQKPSHWHATCAGCLARLDSEIECEEEGTERMCLLQAHRRRLHEEAES